MVLCKIPSDDEAVAFVQASQRRPHTAGALRFERYKVARTLREARALGASAGDLRCDLSRDVLHRATKLQQWSITHTVQLFAPSDNKKIAFAPNLKKPNTKAFERYRNYSKAKTLGEAKKLGIWPGDVANDISRGLLGSAKSRWEAMGLKFPKRLVKAMGIRTGAKGRKSAKDKAQTIGRKTGAKAGKSAKEKAARAIEVRSLCKREYNKMSTCMTFENDRNFAKTAAKEKTRLKEKEANAARNARRREERVEGRAKWTRLGGSMPLSWNRRGGWTA